MDRYHIGFALTKSNAKKGWPAFPWIIDSKEDLHTGCRNIRQNQQLTVLLRTMYANLDNQPATNNNDRKSSIKRRGAS